MTIDGRGTRWALAAIAALGLALRLHGALRGSLMPDESVIWSFAQEISLVPGGFHLVTRTAEHPLLSVYLVRLSSLLFGESDAGLRGLHLIVGTATILLVFRLGAELWSERAGLIAAGLLAVDQFHVSWSRFLGEETLQLFFELAALLYLRRALATGRRGSWLLAGIALGAAYLAKETALLLLPALGLAAVLSPRARRACRSPGPWLALAATASLIALDLGLHLARPEQSHIGRTLRFLALPLGLTPKASSLYLGELYRVAVHPDVLDPDYARGNAYAAFWPAGALYLAAVAWGLARARSEVIRALVVLFLAVFLPVSLVDATRRFDPFWWSALSFPPALLLAARLLASATGRTRAALALAALLLAAYDLTWLAQPGTAAPRLSRTEWARRTAGDGEERLLAGDEALAWEQAQESLLLDADCVPGHFLLARLYERRGDYASALRHLEHARRLESQRAPRAPTRP